MKKLGVLVLAAGLLLGMSGCSGYDNRTTNVEETVVEMTVLLNDGRTLLCVVPSGYSSVSCDWPNAQ